jgi:hypothetical protein
MSDLIHGDARRRVRARSSSESAKPSQARGSRVGELPARHAQPAPSPFVPAPLAHAPSAQRPLVHCTSNWHGAPAAAAVAGPHAPSPPETLSSARQRSLGAHVRSQQMPSSQCPLAHWSPRVH